MKTAEEYWDEHMVRDGKRSRLDNYWGRGLPDFMRMFDSIRADALAEKPAADADEERVKRELAKLDECCRKHGMSSAPWAEQFRNSFAAYVKTLPPRPVRSPGQRLADALREVDFMSGKLSECAEAKFERAATALGIKPQE